MPSPQVHRALFARESAVDDCSWIDDVVPWTWRNCPTCTGSPARRQAAASACDGIRLLGREPPVAVAVAGDRLLALAGVLRGDPLDDLLHELVILGLDRDVGAGPADAGRRLVHHDPRIRQRAALPLRPQATA